MPALAGYCGCEFWSRLVLQVSQHEKSVWHALIALGSLHENFETDNTRFGIDFLRHEQNSFAIREYLAAIRALLGLSNAAVGSVGNVTVDVCLISCILFTCFEVCSLFPEPKQSLTYLDPLWSLWPGDQPRPKRNQYPQRGLS